MSTAAVSIKQTDNSCERALDLLRRSVGRESVTGNEANFVDLLEKEMTERGLSPQKAEFLPNRPIIWGERKGSGKGKRLLYIGHTDTVHVQGWREHWAGKPQEDPFGAVEIDGEIWGRGVADLKGGICASLAALDLLDDAGITTQGDVAFAFVGDEESGEPGTGKSEGIKAWVQKVLAGEIAKPDFAIYVEPTKLDVYTSQIGFFIADVKVTGKSAYFGKPELGVDALKAAHKILASLWRHTAELESRPQHDMAGKSSLLVTEISGGGYIAVPGECSFSLIRKLCPGEQLDQAVSDFEDAMAAADTDEQIEVDISYPAGRDHEKGGSPVEIPTDNEDALLLAATVKKVSQAKGAIDCAPYWSETPFFVNELNCPAVYCAPGDISVCHTHEERLLVDEYLEAVKVFAMFNMEYCNA